MVVPESAIAFAVRCASCPTPSITLKVTGDPQPVGAVIAQVVTPDGVLLLDARAHPAPKGMVKLELMPMDPATFAWFGGQS